jgi:hypothetical protein
MAGEQKATAESAEIRPWIVGLLDVLGFSAWVEREELSSIVATYRQLVERAFVRYTARGGLASVRVKGGSIFALTGPPHVAYFSDTILLWAPLDRPFVDEFVGRCSSILCEALAMGVPLRGAITIGEAVLDEDTSTYIGRPLVEAAMLEKGQNWIGLCFGESAMWPPFVAQLHGANIIEYPAPMKPAYAEFASPVVVDWPRRWREDGRDDLGARIAELNVDPNFSFYWENAARFAEESAARHDWFKHPDSIPPDACLRLISEDEADLG